MAFLETMKETFEAGDPTFRSWALVNSNWMPTVLCVIYVFFVKRLGPALMQHRKPFDLRLAMIVYNFTVVAVYLYCLAVLIFYFLTTDIYRKVCNEYSVAENHYTYKIGVVAWYIYILKYVEFTDTVFFVLRKKYHLITNLHLIHHTVLPMIAWIMIRTEKSGFQMVPGGINSFVHIIMYTYYGLAAMGPEVQKKLWWKEYLTLLQMAQFIVILVFVFVVVPLLGCKTTIYGIYLDIVLATLFLGLFYNFYVKTYKNSLFNKKIQTTEMGHRNGSTVQKETTVQNGNHSKSC